MADQAQEPGNAQLSEGQVLSPPPPAIKDPQGAGGGYGAVPAMTSGMTYTEVGNSGLRAFAGWVREEFLPQLTGRQGAQKYREMMDNSPIIGAIMASIVATMRKVEWRVEPADDSGEAAEAADFLDSCRDDMTDTWEENVVEDLSMLGYGFAAKEIVYKKRMGRDPGKAPDGTDLGKSDYDDGLIGWRRLPIRGQDTVLKWFFDANGEIKGMTQQPWSGALIDIPIEKLLLFRPSQHKNNPEGRSILRTSYVPYYFIKRLQEQEAILGERMGGLPCVKVPSELIQAASDGDAIATAAMAAYKKMATNIRIDEQMGILMPSDMQPGPNGPSSSPAYSFELVVPQGGRGMALNINDTVNRYNTQILTSVLADFLTMGHDARGAQNLGQTKIDLFYQAIEGFLNSNAAIYNRHAIPRLWRLNGFDMDYMPKLIPDLAIRVDLDVLSNFVTRLASAGMPIFPNDDVQRYLLEAAGLPDVVDDERALMAAGLTDEQLAMANEQEKATLEQMKNPPAAKTPLQKMILKAFAQRLIRAQGNRFNIDTTKPIRKKARRRIR